MDRLRRGTRLLHPLTGTYYKYGGRWVSIENFVESGDLIISMRLHGIKVYFLVGAHQVVSRREKRSKPKQERMF